MRSRSRAVKGRAIAVVVILAALASAALPVSAGVAVNFNGYGFFEDGSPAWFESLSITNTRTGVAWNDTYFGIGHPQVALWQNYYVLTLDDPANLISGDVLKYVAANETGTNVSYLTYDPAITGWNPEHNITFHRTAEKPRIGVCPERQNISLGDACTINVTVDPAGIEIYGAQFMLDFNQNVLNATVQSTGTFLSQDGASTMVIINNVNNTIGRIEYGETRVGVEDGVTNPGTLSAITFRAVKPGSSELNLSFVMLSDPNVTTIATDISCGTVTVVGATPFTISGFVTYLDGTPILNPAVTVTNLNTSEILNADTNETSNYYAITTDSNHVNAGDVLHFTASTDNTTSFNHTITLDDMTAGGFVQNITISPAPRPDLVAVDILAQPAFAEVSTNVSAVITNDGNADADSFNVSFMLNETTVNRDAVPGLAVGNSTTLTFLWTPSQTGVYQITVHADCDMDVTESNETNNVLSTPVSVRPQTPDLILEGIEAYHYQTPRVWFNLTNVVNISILNDGFACSRFNVTLNIDGLALERAVDGLGSGARTNVLFTWTPIGEDCMKGGGPKAYTSTFRSIQMTKSTRRTRRIIMRVLQRLFIGMDTLRMSPWIRSHTAHCGAGCITPPGTLPMWVAVWHQENQSVQSTTYRFHQMLP